MEKLVAEPPAIKELAHKVSLDIRRRGLSVGDRYLTSDQVGRMLGVRKATANRAMQLLARQNLLVRRQRSGTFVGPGIDAETRPRVQLILVLLEADRDLGHLPCDELLIGIRQSLPEARVQFAFLPDRNQIEFVEQLLDDSAALDRAVGVVPISCSREVYQWLIDRQQPAVVLGSVYPGTDVIASIDGDYDQAGRLLADYLLSQGRTRIGLFVHHVWYPGDNAFVESMNRALSAADLRADSLIVRSVPNDSAVMESEMRRLLDSTSRPSAIICRNLASAKLVREVAESLDLSVPADVLIVHEQFSPVDGRSEFPSLTRSVSFREIAADAGRLLARQMEQRKLTGEHRLVPFKLQLPNGDMLDA